MSKQNIYDNELFFKEYRKLRNKVDCANELIEKPALFSMLPDLREKSVLDLGCGYGENCMEFVQRGASSVVGIDISARMLEVAKQDHADANISYIHISMEDIGKLQQSFDVILSSLAVHYIKDFSALCRDVYNMLNPNGCFIFSQEHPLNTCFTEGTRWTKDENGQVLHANTYMYGEDGERRSLWFIDGVVKYHRTFSTIFNALADAGFVVKRCCEPIPNASITEKYPTYARDVHKPDFLFIKAERMD